MQANGQDIALNRHARSLATSVGWTSECRKLKDLYDPYRHWSLCDDGAGTVSHCGYDRAASYKASRFDRKAEGKS